MNTRISTVLLLTSILITGCSMAHGDPEHPARNPHPVQRYEIVATATSPGPWDKVTGYISYETTNPKCTPFHKFIGVYEKPTDVGLDIEMTRVSEDTWKGYFYRDYLQDEDYYGLGVCHWDAVSAGAGFVVHGGIFGASDLLDVLLKGPQTTFFKKNDFGGADGGYGTNPGDPDVVQHPHAYFAITITVEEEKP